MCELLALMNSRSSSATTTESDTDGPDPIFLLGTERSGTNLVRRILDSHSDVCAPHPIESSFRSNSLPSPPSKVVRPFIRDSLILMYFSHHVLYEAIDIDDVVERVENGSLPAFQRAMYDTFADSTDSNRWMSKWPSNITYIEDIDDYYDDPKYIHLVRDCRDNVLSKKNNEPGEFHPYFASQRWRDEQAKIFEFVDDTSSTVHQIRYEDLLANPEHSVKSLCESLELEYEPAMLLYHESDKGEEEAKKHHAFENLSSPIKSDNYGKFHNGLTNQELIITEKVAGTYLRQLGYSLETNKKERDKFEFEPTEYRAVANQREREFRRGQWQTNPRERVRMTLRTLFNRYLMLRYEHIHS